MDEKRYALLGWFSIMQTERTGIDLLEERHAIRVLLFLHAKREISRGSLYKELNKGIRVVLDRVNSLRDMGLIRETVQPVKPFTKMLELTEKGKRVAEHLRAIEDELTRL